MKQEDIIRMARQAGAWPELSETPVKDVAFLKRFAELVLAEEIQCVRVLCEVLVGCEREAILELVDSYAKNNTDLADAIRARGQA